ncbi:MAG: hypothetical protein K2H21_10875 [Muribaculaceae bacterium]|nr:hypothetical protein [Muribaculaceae bacterium]
MNITSHLSEIHTYALRRITDIHRCLAVLLAFSLALLTGVANALTIRVISADNNEPIPFATIDLHPIGYGVADANGELRFDLPNDTTSVRGYITAFNHKPLKCSISAGQVTDDLFVASLEPAYLTLWETTVTPLKNGKLKYLGRKRKGLIKAKMGVPNTPPTAGQLDSLGRILSVGVTYFMGIELETRKNKFNRLTGVGINIVNSDRMVPCISFRVRIYDGDTISTPGRRPVEIYEPIYFDIRKEDVKGNTFLYKLPVPLDMPPTAVLTVEPYNFIPDEDFTIAVFNYTSKKGRWYRTLDPLREAEPIWIFHHRRPTIMYLEYMEYDAPESTD